MDQRPKCETRSSERKHKQDIGVSHLVFIALYYFDYNFSNWLLNL